MTTRVLRLMMCCLISVWATLMVGCVGHLTGQPLEPNGKIHVRLGQEFKLRIGQQATLEGQPFKVKFASVANDSRCPANVTCIWAGNAEVLIEAEAGGRRANLKLNTNGGNNFSKEGRHQHLIVALVALDPRPRADSGIKATDYVATLVIRKEGPGSESVQ